MSGFIQLGLRGWTFLWTLLTLALVGNMEATAGGNSSASTNYAMFVAAFAMFSLLYLIPASWNPDWAIHPIIMITVDALNSLFTFTSAVAYAALLGAHNCGNPAYTLTNEITNSSSNTKKRCHEAQASTAFLWFMWAGFTASLVLSVLAGRSTGVNLRGRTGSRRGPSMAQV